VTDEQRSAPILTVGSLFTGIGGIDLGLERAGMKVIWQSEIDPYAAKVLAKHWPDVPNLGDVTLIDWSDVDRPDLIAGGYPCQPFSFAGRRGGVGDPRHLWPHMCRALRLLRPEWAVLENVPGHLGLGFADVLADLAALRFDAEWELLPAAAFGAPHLRYRLFVVAHADSESQPDGTVDAALAGSLADPDSQQLRERTRSVPGTEGTGESEGPQRERVRPDLGNGGQVVAHPDSPGQTDTQRRPTLSQRSGRRTVECGCLVDPDRVGRREGPGVFGRLGIEKRDWWGVEPDVGRVAHGIPSRVDRLRCLGNAVVPQVAEYVGRCIIDAI